MANEFVATVVNLSHSKGICAEIINFDDRGKVCPNSSKGVVIPSFVNS